MSGDDAELEYWAVTDGMPQEDATELGELAAAVVGAKTLGDLEALGADLKGTRTGAMLNKLLGSIGAPARKRIAKGVIDASDPIRAALILLHCVSEHEREDIVRAAVRYGHQLARARHSFILNTIKKDAALVHALGGGDESLRRTAKRMGISVAALSERVARLRAKIHR